MHLLAFAFLVVLALAGVVVAVVVRVVVCSSTWSPAGFHPVSRFTTVLASVDVGVARVVCASSFLVLFAFAHPFSFKKVDLLPGVVIRTCSICS